MSKERWRWVVGYEGLYLVSDLGRVMSVPRIVDKGRIGKHSIPGVEVRPQEQNSGYLFVRICKGDGGKQFLVHRLVATAFLGAPEEGQEVNHKNGDKHDNSAKNLEWVTRSENINHRFHALGEHMPRKLSDDTIKAIRRDKRTQRAIADEVGVSQSSIAAIQTGKIYRDAPGDIRMPDARSMRQRKLNNDQVRDIRSSCLTGVALAAKYGVATSTISKIKSKKRYREVV